MTRPKGDRKTIIVTNMHYLFLGKIFDKKNVKQKNKDK